ncbi:MAG: ArsB/NhaD family transporter [Candidatus Brocadiaceae bacterium]|nr:ArsB/NhaD family transporter [Candidatus Brocadiaceae bacterium]
MVFWVATLIFVVSFGLIVTEKIDKTKVALIGAGLMMILKIVSQHEAFYDEHFSIDYNVIFLLISMMIIVNILKKTGIFEFVAIKSAKLARGRPFLILVFFACLTAFASALLDNVTSVLLLIPVTLFIAEELELDPFPFLITEIMACNIGGTATLIGDPPNIMIASKVHLTFMDFIYHMTPAVASIFVAFLLTIKFLFGKKLQVNEEVRKKILAMDEYSLIKDVPLLKKSLGILGFVILGFVFHGVFHYEPATIALFGAAILLVISKEDIHHVFHEIEWSTLFFFIGLFIIVGGVVKVGLVSKLSAGLIALTNPSVESMFTTSIVILWFSAIGSAVVDNIPFVASMIPLVKDTAHGVLSGGWELDALLQHPSIMPVWWSLALGACLGGNGSPVGASANVITIGLAGKAGFPITFRKFLLYSIPITFETLVIATLYVWLRYYTFG